MSMPAVDRRHRILERVAEEQTIHIRELATDLDVSEMTIRRDITRLEHGPTQYVPGSHYSGRPPASQEDPVFEGQGPKTVFCHAGDIYFTNHQTWHRGAPNTSNRTRISSSPNPAAMKSSASSKPA